VAGGILGGGIVVVLIGVYLPAITMLANIFFCFLVLQLVCFIAGLAFLFAYCYTFGKPNSKHRTWGLLAAISPLIVKVTFSAGVAFTNNPGSWPSSGSIWAAVFDPLTVPMLLHRLVAGVSLVGFFIVAYGLWKARKPQEESEQTYARFAVRLGGRLALWSAVAQIIPGALILFVGLPAEGRSAVLGDLLLPWLLALLLLLPVRAQAGEQANRQPVAVAGRDLHRGDNGPDGVRALPGTGLRHGVPCAGPGRRVAGGSRGVPGAARERRASVQGQLGCLPSWLGRRCRSQGSLPPCRPG
jgi:hypothetical protein